MIFNGITCTIKGKLLTFISSFYSLFIFTLISLVFGIKRNFKKEPRILTNTINNEKHCNGDYSLNGLDLEKHLLWKNIVA